MVMPYSLVRAVFPPIWLSGSRWKVIVQVKAAIIGAVLVFGVDIFVF